ncbi:nucleotidyltransferase family protein [Catellatospora sp. KI3]|uniref:nucleotidyltransferase family protein n=1 Tax=Catellatospora sp. KI3 TaxID=3041620 RepID=UPI002482F909|nr:nucleotidyltransferase family protein [Catellatospora sp. KI3]MDI1464590.1 nucleotidyltransferase family protein [Catellatospora sp. KI3]
MSTAGLLLAAGAGRRYGMPKALAQAPGGAELLVQRALRTLREGGCDPVVVVLGAGAEQAPPLPGAQVVVNEDWPTGMGSSLRAGLDALPEEVTAVVVLLVDTPGVTPQAVRRIAADARATTLRVATYSGDGGHPVLLGRDHWDGASRLAVGDVGARPYLVSQLVEEVPCDDIAIGTDLDTPPDLRDSDA